MELISFFKKIYPLSDDNCAILNTLFQEETHPKGEIILKPNNRSQKLIFVEEGLIRLFYNKDEKDITFLFLNENSFSLPIENVLNNRSSPYGWEVLQQCTIRSVQYKELETMFNKIEGLELIARHILIRTLQLMSSKFYSLQFQTAEQRYDHMFENYKDVLLNAPLGHIASFLGITQQTLSVLRRNKQLKK